MAKKYNHWVNENILPVEIVIVDKRNNNLIKRKIS